MECLQYPNRIIIKTIIPSQSFKPCYKWNAFNTKRYGSCEDIWKYVLNLVINGMPSILKL